MSTENRNLAVCTSLTGNIKSTGVYDFAYRQASVYVVNIGRARLVRKPQIKSNTGTCIDGPRLPRTKPRTTPKVNEGYAGSVCGIPFGKRRFFAKAKDRSI